MTVLLDQTMDFAFDFTTGSSGMVTFFNTINAGQSYNGSASFTLTGLGATVAGNPFSANFVATMLSPATLGPLGPMTVDAFLAANAPPLTFNVTGSMSTTVNNIPVSLTLNSASITQNLGNYILTLKTTETGNNLSSYLTLSRRLGSSWYLSRSNLNLSS